MLSGRSPPAPRGRPTLQTLHVGLGPLGRQIARDLLERGLGRIAGAVDPSPSLIGVPVSRIVPGARGAGAVLGSLDAFRAWRRLDGAIVATASSLAACAPTFRALLERGLTVVSTCEELVWPWLRNPGLADELDRLARRRGGRLLGTGVNPGFLMDALPLAATAVQRRIERVEVHRVQDASTRRLGFQRKIGVGLDRREFAERVLAGTLRHVGLGESLHFLAHTLRLPIDHWDEEIHTVRAARALESSLGPIARGRASGVRQVARGYAGERLVIQLHFQAAIAQPDPHDRVVIRGEPGLDLLIRGGVHGDVATAAIALNALPSLGCAPPGLHTMATIPLVHFAAGR